MRLLRKAAALALMASAIFQANAGDTLLADYRVIPLPREIELNGDKDFVLAPDVAVSYNEAAPELNVCAALAADYIEAYSGRLPEVKASRKKGKNEIRLTLSDKISRQEGYELRVNDGGVEIIGRSPEGIMHGIQTLRKSLPAKAEEHSVTILPSVCICDYPEFAYRSLLLDCGRHFFPVKDVMQIIDIMALHNLNVLHWHLTDDQGWRPEIRRYPQITEKGSYRRGTEIGWEIGLNDSIPHGGSYSQADMHRIVEYARDRGIEVIPEIDMPGHTGSLLASFPQIGCTGGPYEVSDHWGVHSDILCAGKEKTYDILHNIVDDILPVFPTQYFIVGGDEADKTRWKECPDCQKKIAALGLKSEGKRTAEQALQGYFTRRMQSFLQSRGKRAVGWNEILESGADSTAVIINRYSDDRTVEAIGKGFDVIASEAQYCYFDYYQTEDRITQPKFFPLGPCITLSKVYSFRPVPDGVPADRRKQVIGVQANLWTEFIPNIRVAEYQLLPRLAALCEKQWREADAATYGDFSARLPRLTDIYKANSYFFCRLTE